jgi:hypothetical protein
MLQRCCKLSSRSVYPGFSASSPGQAATQRNPLHSLRFLPSSRETATQAQTGDAYVTSEVLYQLSYVGRLAASVADASGAVSPVGSASSSAATTEGAAGARDLRSERGRSVSARGSPVGVARHLA